MKAIKSTIVVFIILTVIVCSIGCKKEKNIITVTSIPSTSQTRIYYIAAEEVTWDYASQGMNVFAGMPFDANDSVFAANQSNGPTPRIGRKYKKARYVEYTDTSFSTPKPIPSEWQHLGLLGPTIRANVEDSVVVYFKNKTTINTSLNVHGLMFDVNSNGAVYNNGATGGSSISPNGKYMYKYYVPENLAPASSYASSTVWLYHSMVQVSDIYAGLFGAIIITKKGMGDENAKPTDVDREFITMFFVSNENNSPYLLDNESAYCPGFTNPNPGDFEESNKKHSINGMIMGNLPGLIMKQGERVRWYLLGLGNEVDIHTPHWMGNAAVVVGQATDVISLLPASSVVADMKPNNPGTWGFLCHVADHMMGGMTSLYSVQK